MIGQYLLMGVGYVAVTFLAVAAPLGVLAGIQRGDVAFAVYCGAVCLTLIAAALMAMGV